MMLSLAITICMQLYLGKAMLAQQDLERVIYVVPEDQSFTHCPKEETAIPSDRANQS